MARDKFQIFCCNICYYYTSRKSQFDRYATSDKHKNQIFVNKNKQKKFR